MKTGVKIGVYFMGWCLFMALVLSIGEGLHMQLNLGIAALIALAPVILFGISIPRLTDLRAHQPHSRLGYDFRIVFFLILIIGLLFIMGGSAFVWYFEKIGWLFGVTILVSLTFLPVVGVLLGGLTRLMSMRRRSFIEETSKSRRQEKWNEILDKFDPERKKNRDECIEYLRRHFDLTYAQANAAVFFSDR